MSAHEIRPAYLRITQASTVDYQVYWKIPSINGKYVNIEPIFPQVFSCKISHEEILANAIVRSYNCTCQSPLAGQNIAIKNLEKTLVDVLLHINLSHDLSYSYLLQSDKPSIQIPVEPNQWEVVKTYIGLGFTHILVGWDHLLFVLGLLLLVRNVKKLLCTITAFTLAHSITMALASMKLFTLPSPPVEAVIALSIVFLAREFLLDKKGKKSLTTRHPWIVAFGFGLLHGFGFAGVLIDLGFPQKQLPLALLNFNFGVEIGQLVFIGICVLFSYFLNKLKFVNWSLYFDRGIPYVMGSIGMFWVIERILKF